MQQPLPTSLQASLFGARQRLHIQHGPTDLVIDADGPDRLILFEAALDAMRDVLSGLADELRQLRAPWDAQDPPSGPVAMRMHAACSVAGDRFVTPMAAVAGAIAEGMGESSGEGGPGGEHQRRAELRAAVRADHADAGDAVRRLQGAGPSRT